MSEESKKTLDRIKELMERMTPAQQRDLCLVAEGVVLATEDNKSRAD